MHHKKQLDQLSRLRQNLRELLDDLDKSLRVTFGRAPMVKGNVYELARKCGKPNCACTRGQLHRSMVLTWSHEGRSKLFSIPAERVGELQEKSSEYLRFRRARAQVTQIGRKILAVMDRIEKLRREDP
jgi:hypothetical protein